MIPHLPTIIPNMYTVEAWVRPAKVGPMNIICRTDYTFPQQAWSHQLRINAQGRLEHFCGETVSHTVTVQAGHWYHVAGVAVGGGEMKLVVNGKEEGNSTEIGPLRPQLDRYFIGSSSGDGMKMFEGTIAEVRVWNYAQTEDEIHDNMRRRLSTASLIHTRHLPTCVSFGAAGGAACSLWCWSARRFVPFRRVLNGTERGLVGYWRINEGPGTVSAAYIFEI